MGNISTGLCTDRCSQQQEPTSCYSTDSQRLHHCCSCKQGWKYQPEASLSMPTAQVLHPTQETSQDQAMIKQSVHKVISISSVLQANKLQTSSSHTQWWQKETLITDKNLQSLSYMLPHHARPNRRAETVSFLFIFLFSVPDWQAVPTGIKYFFHQESNTKHHKQHYLLHCLVLTQNRCSTASNVLSTFYINEKWQKPATSMLLSKHIINNQHLTKSFPTLSACSVASMLQVFVIFSLM